MTRVLNFGERAYVQGILESIRTNNSPINLNFGRRLFMLTRTRIKILSRFISTSTISPKTHQCQLISLTTLPRLQIPLTLPATSTALYKTLNNFFDVFVFLPNLIVRPITFCVSMSLFLLSRHGSHDLLGDRQHRRLWLLNVFKQMCVPPSPPTMLKMPFVPVSN